MMELITNEVSLDNHSVRTETRDGDNYLVVEDVPFIKSMTLNNGYVPETEVRRVVQDWDGVPLTANHPRNKPGEPWYNPEVENDAPVSSSHPEVRKNYKVGEAENPEWDGTHTRVDMAINEDVAMAMGGAASDIVSKIKSGELVEVSSQYQPRPLPAANYDGEYRRDVGGIEEPDCIAILPNKSGACSIEDRCGINPELAANSEVTVPMQVGNKSVAGVTFTGTSDGKLEESAIPNDDFESHYLFPGETKSESSYPVVDGDGNLRRGNVESAFGLGARGGVSESELHSKLKKLNSEFDSPPIDEEKLTANEGRLAELGRRVANALGIEVESEDLDGGQRDEETSDGVTSKMDESERERLIKELVGNTELKQESLEGMGDTCLKHTHSELVSNKTQTTDSSGDDDAGEAAEEVVLTEDELEDLIEEKAEEKAEEAIANHEERSQKEKVVDEIIANSTEYDDDNRDELLDTPLNVLEGLRSNLGSTGILPGRGVTGNAGESDASSWASPIASERAKELESDD